MSDSIVRRLLLIGAAAVCLLPAIGARAADALHIGSTRGTIDFAIGDSRLFRTQGSFKQWQGTVQVDDQDVSRSNVTVKIDTRSVEMMDAQQSSMLKDSDFFDVARYPEMTYVSRKVERTGNDTFKVEGDVTLRGVTRPMTLAVSVTERRPDAGAGVRYALFKATGSVKRSEFGMTKFVDMVGDTVDFTIRTDAWR